MAHFDADTGDAVGTQRMSCGPAGKYKPGAKTSLQASPEGAAGGGVDVGVTALSLSDICRPICPCCFYFIDKKQKDGKKKRRRPVRPREEHVFYDSATFKRSFLGNLHYKCCCPPWNKITSTRVVGSVWEYKDCCGFSCRSGRVTDMFMADLIQDVQVEQTCCQVCRNEGDLIFHRDCKGDVSSSSNVFVVYDVPDIFNIYDEIARFLASTFNLKGYVKQEVVEELGYQKASPHPFSGVNEEVVGGSAEVDKSSPELYEYYNSTTAERNFCGYMMHLHCCCPDFFKVTQDAVLYSTWTYTDCCGMCSLPCKRTLDFFDMDIVLDLQATQKLTQICATEGDLKFYKAKGGDHSDQDSPYQIVSGVPDVYAVFDDLSYDLSNMGLKNFVINSMGAKIDMPASAPAQQSMGTE